ncbi:hypothetical protein ERJ75_000335100 [Trypanosoma vivax]|nr:hypothetical protein ERJ75_000335100 [Trypanosoma vivax]
MRSGHSNYLYIVEREFANTLLKLKGNGFIKHNRINICARTVLEELVTLLYREEKEALGNIYGLKQVLLDNRGRKQKLSKSVNIISKWNLTLSDISAQAEMTKMHYNDVNQMNNDARKLMGAAQQCAKGTSTWLARFGSHYTNVEVAANRLESKGIKERNKTLKSMHVIHEAILSCKDRMHVTNGIRKILKNTHTHNAADVTLKSIGTRLHDIEQMKGKHRKTILDINRAIDILNIESEVLLRQVSAVTDTINKNEVALKSLSKKFPIIGVEVDWNHDDMECTAVSQKMLLAIEEENIYSDVCHADGAAKRTKILDDFKSLLATLQEDVAREKGDLENTTINAVADVSVARAIVDSMRLGEMQAKNAAKIALEADRIATRDVWHTLNKQDEIHSSTCIPLHEQLLRAVFGN